MASQNKLLPHTQWLHVNWNTLVKANLPAMKIIDRLVSSGVYSPLDDDYQRVQTEPRANEKVRVLLETILPKSANAFKLFKEALAGITPSASSPKMRSRSSPMQLVNIIRLWNPNHLPGWKRLSQSTQAHFIWTFHSLKNLMPKVWWIRSLLVVRRRSSAKSISTHSHLNKP